MINLNFFKTISFTVLLLSSFAYSNSKDVFSGTDQPIQVRSVANNSGNHRPHSMVVIPFDVYYNAEISSILVYFLNDIGEVEVSIQNTLTGEYLNFSINSKIKTAIFPISSDSGLYFVTFTLSEGSQYEGQLLL